MKEKIKNQENGFPKTLIDQIMLLDLDSSMNIKNWIKVYETKGEMKFTHMDSNPIRNKLEHQKDKIRKWKNPYGFWSNFKQT